MAPGTKNFFNQRSQAGFPEYSSQTNEMGYGKLDLASSYEQVLNL